MSSDIFNLNSFLRALGSYSPWTVGIELLLIGAVVYWIMRFLRGTRGARLLRGIALVLIGLYVIIKSLDSVGFARIAFLYEQFLGIAAIGVIIVFQPELRRALQRLGETRLFRAWSTQVHEEIDQLVEAANFCAKRKIGALIAIERDVGLGGIADSSTRLNADLSAALLNTIFWPNSPLHDLGVVISQGKIAFAGVQFPLAEEGTIERELGSRHRAAVGLSNESDAVVIVVSEETGDISIAERGVLLRKLTPEALRDMLIELLGAGEQKSSQHPGGGMSLLNAPSAASAANVGRAVSRSLTRQNIVASIKTFAWLAPLTVLIWIYAERKQVITTSAPGDIFPVEIVTQNPNFYVSVKSPSEKFVQAQFRGPAVAIDELNQKIVHLADRPTVVITLPKEMLPNTPYKRDAAELLATSPAFSHGVTPVNCKPASIEFVIDAMVEREVEVQTPAVILNQNLVGVPVYSPARVHVRAPSADFPQNMQEPLIVEAVLEQTGAMLNTPGNYTATVPLKAVNIRGEAISITPANVKVTFEVRPVDEPAIFPSVPIRVTARPDQLKKFSVDVEPTFGPIKVEGPKEKIAELQRDHSQLAAVLELSEDDFAAAQNSGTKAHKKLQFPHLPDGVHVIEAELPHGGDVEFRLVLITGN